jgi:hypothetical protein
LLEASSELAAAAAAAPVETGVAGTAAAGLDAAAAAATGAAAGAGVAATGSGRVADVVLAALDVLMNFNINLRRTWEKFVTNINSLVAGQA